MPIDSKGTRPGLTPEKEAPPTVFMRCKNDSCGSNEAIEMVIPGNDGIRLYRCAKCHRTSTVGVGMPFNF